MSAHNSWMSRVTESLRAYAWRRDRLVPWPRCDRFFLRDGGSGANQRGILYALQTLCQQLGWHPRGDYVEADLAMKVHALASIAPPETKHKRYHPSDAVLNFLESL